LGIITQIKTGALFGWHMPVVLHQQVPADAPFFAIYRVNIAPIKSIYGAIIGNN
jgi:hypothetical protein